MTKKKTQSCTTYNASGAPLPPPLWYTIFKVYVENTHNFALVFGVCQLSTARWWQWAPERDRWNFFDTVSSRRNATQRPSEPRVSSASAYPLGEGTCLTLSLVLLRPACQALQDELERSRLELEQAVKEKDSIIAAKDKEISQVGKASFIL